MVEAGIGQLKPEEVLPIDARPHGFGGLTIAQAFAELHQSDEGEPPGRVGRLAALGIELSKVGVAEDWAQPIAEREVRAALGKGGASDPGSGFRHRRDGVLGMERHSRTSSQGEAAALTPFTPIRPTHSPTVSDPKWDSRTGARPCARWRATRPEPPRHP